MSFVYPGIKSTFEEFVQKTLKIKFTEFDKLAENDYEKRIKRKILKYFVYKLGTHNGIMEINQTFISFSKEIFKQLSDSCTDLYGKYLYLLSIIIF